MPIDAADRGHQSSRAKRGYVIGLRESNLSAGLTRLAQAPPTMKHIGCLVVYENFGNLEA